MAHRAAAQTMTECARRRSLREPATLLLCAALSCCASNVDEDAGYESRASLIQFSPMYSAFDDGAHEFALTLGIPSATADSGRVTTDMDPVLASTVQWEVDAAFVKRDELPAPSAGIKLTTKKAGKTFLKATAKTLKGNSVRTEARLIISKATQNEWDAGERRYSDGAAITWMLHVIECELPVDFELPETSACSNCHNSRFTSEPTPTRTAGYSDEDLVNIFTTGAKPAGLLHNSALLHSLPMPDCVYKAFHTWQMTDEEKMGVVWKLRSMPPKLL